MTTIEQKLRKIMQVTGWKQAKLAEKLGVTQATVSRWFSGSEPEGARRDAINEIYERLAPSDPSVGIREVTVVAHVQAGNWTETWEWDEQDQYPAYIPDDAIWRRFKLYGAEARGPSMNKRYPEGTVLVFAAIEETKEQPIAGKRYIVERRRPGGEAEHTVKLLYVDPEGKFWLVPESDDPRFQAPISVEDGTGDEDVVAIIGRVCYAVLRE